jgi:glycosyltransferase involved in cell wall biosynthesis
MPWPLDDGGRIVMWQLLWAASRAAETTLVTLLKPEEMVLPVPAPVREACAAVERVAHRPRPMAAAALAGAFGPRPYTIARYRSAALEAALRRHVATRPPDVALVNHLSMASHVDGLAGVPVVLREHNVEYRWLERYAETLSNPLARAYTRLQARRMRRTEADLCTRMDLVLAMHEEEAALLRRLAPAARVEVVPIGIDLGRFEAPRPVDPPEVLLVASFGWPPNVQGARAFLAAGWPGVQVHVPRARLRVVGKDLPADLAALARAAGAEPVGYVESTVPEFARATAMVVPLWAGGGARVKIVEALAAGLPVVSTALGAEGLGLEAGRHYLEAATPAALGDALVALLLDPARRQALSVAGREFARRSFSLEAATDRTNRLVAEMLTRRGTDHALGARRHA